MNTWTASEKHLLFSETDMSGWAHNSHFMRFIENAEHELFESLGFAPVDAEGGWPRVNFQIDFRSPLVYNDPYQVSLSIGRLGNSSITWEFSVLSGQRLVAEGRMTSVYVSPEAKATPIPESLREGILKTFNKNKEARCKQEE